MYVHVRNDGSANAANSWVFCGDLAYTMENLRGPDLADPQYIPIGLATGSQFNLIMTTEAMVKAVNGDCQRVIPVHEERLRDLYPSRITKTGLRITELALAEGEPSRVRS
jgi:hypothetical protein